MADPAIKENIRTELQKTYFNKPDDWVDVSDGDGDNIHVVIVSRQLGGMRAKEKTDLIWSVLTEKTPPAHWGRISLVTATSPEELKSF